MRSYQPQRPGITAAATFGQVRSQVDEALKLASEHQPDDASARVFDAYMTFEGVEREVRAKNPSLAATLEASFAELRSLAAGGAPASQLAGARTALLGQLENAERTLGDTLSGTSLFLQSFFLLVREGLEAILIIGALLTFLAKTGAQDRKRDIHVGVGAAVLASLFTAVLLETVFQVTPAKREVLEGAVMLTASAVLFYVSYWLLSKIEVARWNQFVRSRVQDAVTSGSALALATAAFLAVYREGFETVLFYKALVLAGPAGSTFVPVTAGIALGSLVLVAVYYAINRFGVRLPLKPFFAVTGPLPVLHGVPVRRSRHRRTAGRRDHRDNGAAMGSTRSGARHLSDGRVTGCAGRPRGPAARCTGVEFPPGATSPGERACGFVVWPGAGP